MNEFEQNNNASADTPAETPADNVPAEPTPAPETPATDEGASGGGMGPIVGIIIIVIVVIIGGLYLWGGKLAKDSHKYDGDHMEELHEELAELEGEAAELQDDIAEALNTQGSSDAIDDIAADLDATDLGDLDINLEDIEFDF